MHFEDFWKRSADFFETSKKSFLSVKMRRNFYLSLVQRHKGPFRSNKNLEFSSECLDVFFQLKTNQRHIYNFIIRSKLKSLKCFQDSTILTEFVSLSSSDSSFSCHLAFAQHSKSQNGFGITSTGPLTLLKVYRVFFRAQRIDWDAFRRFLNAFKWILWNI